MTITVKIKDVEISFDDKKNTATSNVLAYEKEGSQILKSLKAITDDCIRAYESTKTVHT